MRTRWVASIETTPAVIGEPDASVDYLKRTRCGPELDRSARYAIQVVERFAFDRWRRIAKYPLDLPCGDVHDARWSPFSQRSPLRARTMPEMPLKGAPDVLWIGTNRVPSKRARPSSPPTHSCRRAQKRQDVAHFGPALNRRVHAIADLTRAMTLLT